MKADTFAETCKGQLKRAETTLELIDRCLAKPPAAWPEGVALAGAWI